MNDIEEGWDHCEVCGDERLFRRQGHEPWFCTVCGTRDTTDVAKAADPFGNAPARVESQSAPPVPHHTRRMSMLVGAISLLLVLGAGSGWFFTHRANGPSIPGAGPGVHVCSVSHYVEPGVCCQQIDATVSLDDGYVSYTGLGGNNFSATNLLFVLRKALADGTEQTVAQAHNTVSLATNMMAIDLKSLFSNFNVTPTQGDSYGLEVDSDTGSAQSLIGTTTFTIGPKRPTVCAGQGFSVSIPYGWHISDPCSTVFSATKYFGAMTADQKAGLLVQVSSTNKTPSLNDLQTATKAYLDKLNVTKNLHVSAITIGSQYFALAQASGQIAGRDGTMVVANGTNKTRGFFIIGFVQIAANADSNTELRAVHSSLATVKLL